MSFSVLHRAALYGVALAVSSASSCTVRAQPATSPAPRVTTTLPAEARTALERERRAVWVHWFTADTAALRRALGPELVAMSTGSSTWQTLEESIAASTRFRADGGTLVSVDFEGTTLHRFGETVVMFSRYHVVTSKHGVRSDLRGRATEVFVRSGGRWVHTSWHLDESGASP
ncbi:MAG: nuclear transport factor 2 family protein [Gemmatimonadetes bacterium]|nr:nuclear transport factor 2 family protein [Gemmatimonadota bacterium]